MESGETGMVSVVVIAGHLLVVLVLFDVLLACGAQPSLGRVAEVGLAASLAGPFAHGKLTSLLLISSGGGMPPELGCVSGGFLPGRCQAAVMVSCSRAGWSCVVA